MSFCRLMAVSQAWKDATGNEFSPLRELMIGTEGMVDRALNLEDVDYIIGTFSCQPLTKLGLRCVTDPDLSFLLRSVESFPDLRELSVFGESGYTAWKGDIVSHRFV